MKFLSQFQIYDPSLKEPLKESLLIMFSLMNQESIEIAMELEKQFHKIENNMRAMEKRFVIGEILAELYHKYKTEFELELDKIRQMLDNSCINLSNLEKAIDKVFEDALNLPFIWNSGDLAEKRRIQNLVFPSGMVYDRTERVSGLFAEIPAKIRLLEGNKKGLIKSIDQSTLFVPKTGVEPAHP